MKQWNQLFSILAWERELEAVFDCKHNFHADFLANFAFSVSTTIFASPLQRSQSISGYLIHLSQSQKAPVFAAVLSKSRTSNHAKQLIKTLKSVIKRSGWWKSIPLHHLWLLFFFLLFTLCINFHLKKCDTNAYDLQKQQTKLWNLPKLSSFFFFPRLRH